MPRPPEFVLPDELPCDDCGRSCDDCQCSYCHDCNTRSEDFADLYIAQTDEDADEHGDEPRCLPCWKKLGVYT